MGVLSRDDILKSATAAQLPPELVEVPNFGTLYVRHVGAIEMDDFDAVTAMMRAKDKERPIARNVRARFVAFTLCDAAGKRIMEDVDAVALGKIDTDVIDKIFEAGCRINGKGATATEDIRKNSETTPDAGVSTE